MRLIKLKLKLGFCLLSKLVTTKMNFHKVASKVRTSYITDPYSLVMHYKRAYKYLKLVKDHAGKILVLGKWRSLFDC